MGKRMDKLNERLVAFIERQAVFFVGTAGPDGRVNVSPKGQDSLRVLGPNRVLWLNLTGSGNETAAHLLENPRMTLMFCAFEGKPLILRVYGQAKAYHPRDAAWEDLSAHFPDLPGARQIFDLEIDLVQTSCGMAVPHLAFDRDRQELNQWAEKKGSEGIKAYWQEKNRLSLDGKPTGIGE